MKKTIILFTFFVSLAISADSPKKKVFYLRGTDINVDSASQKNALAIQNSFFFNRYLGGTTNISFVAPQKFSGRGIEVGTMDRHSGLLGTEYGLSFATLFSNSSYTSEFIRSSFTFSTGNSSFNNSIDSYLTSEYTSNRLRTGSLRIVENIFIFHDSGHKFTENFALKLGGEMYGNDLKMKSPYNFGTSRIQSGSTVTDFSGLSYSSVDTITYNEMFLNAVVGFGYQIPVADGHKIVLGAEYYRSVSNSGNYKNKNESFLTLNPTTGLPLITETKGSVRTQIEGNRFQLGYRFELTENLSFGLQYSASFASHRVTNSQIKEKANLLTILSSGQNPIAFALANLPGFGPLPENRDNRNQIAFEIVYQY